MLNTHIVLPFILFFGFTVGASEICIGNDNLSLNPHDYSHCAGVHRPNPATIKDVPGLAEKYKHHLKLETLTPGTGLNHLVTSTSDGIAINQASTTELAKKGVFKAYRNAVSDEVASMIDGGVVDAAELGLSAEAAETLGGLLTAAAPEYVIPIIAIAATSAVVGENLKTTLSNLTGNDQVSAFKTGWYNKLAQRMLPKGTTRYDVIIRDIDSRRKEVTVGVPVRCSFPKRIASKIYINQGHPNAVDFLAANPDFQRLNTGISIEVFGNIKRNLRLIPDIDEQYCDYLRDIDKQAPFHPIRNLRQITTSEHTIISVTRKIILTMNSAGIVTDIAPEQDQYHSDRESLTIHFNGELYQHDSVKMNHYTEPNYPLFSYKGNFGTLRIDTTTRLGKKSVTTPRNHIVFYEYINPGQVNLNPEQPASFHALMDERLKDKSRPRGAESWTPTRFFDPESQEVELIDLISDERTTKIDNIITKLRRIKSLWLTQHTEPVLNRQSTQLYLRWRDDQSNTWNTEVSNRDALLAMALIIDLAGLANTSPAVWEWLIVKASLESLADFAERVRVVTDDDTDITDIVIPDPVAINRLRLGNLDLQIGRRNVGVLSFEVLFRTMAKWQFDNENVDAINYPSACKINIGTRYIQSLINRVSFPEIEKVSISDLIRQYMGSNAVLGAACGFDLTHGLDFEDYDYYFRSLTKDQSIPAVKQLTNNTTGNVLSIFLQGSDGQYPANEQELSTIQRDPINPASVNVLQNNVPYLMKIEPNDGLVFRSQSPSLNDVNDLLNRIGGLTLSLIKVRKNTQAL